MCMEKRPFFNKQRKQQRRQKIRVRQKKQGIQNMIRINYSFIYLIILQSLENYLINYLMNNEIYKIVVLGQGRVGKTSISLKYVDNLFDDNQTSTINASYLQKQIMLQNKQNVKIAIWDTAGQEKYNSIAPVYYRQALGAIVTYEITSSQSFQKVKKWVSQLQQHAPKGIVLTIAGNKADLESQRKVNNIEVQNYAKIHKANHFIVSAKNGLNVKEMFSDLCQKIYLANFEKKNVYKNKRKNPKLAVENIEPQKKSCC